MCVRVKNKDAHPGPAASVPVPLTRHQQYNLEVALQHHNHSPFFTDLEGIAEFELDFTICKHAMIAAVVALVSGVIWSSLVGLK